jgi:tetratricopeptide (TPR) repeat protein
MSGIKSLQQLVSTLSNNELHLVTNYLKAFDSRGEKFESKSLKLLHLLSIPKPHKEHDLEYLLYGRRKVAAFSRLVIRLQDKVIQAVTLPVNSGRAELLSEHRKILSEVRTRLHQTEFLIERGMYAIAEYRLYAVIEKAARFEFFAEQLQALTYLAQVAPKQQQRFEKQLRQTRGQWQFEITCNELYLLSTLEEPQITLTRLAELRSLEQGRMSARAAFLLLETEAQATAKSGHHEQALQCRKKQIRLIEKHPALQNGDKLRESLFAAAGLYFSLLRFPQTIDTVQQCLPHYTAQPEKRRALLEVETAAYLLLNKPAPAFAAITEALTLHPTGKTHYIKALVLFQRGMYAEALEAMENVKWRTADREQYGTAARLFWQMLVIESEPRQEQKTILRKLVSLDKKFPIAVHLNEREQLTVDLMQAVIVSGLDFKQIYQQYQPHIEHLRAKQGATAWNPERWELIQVQEWFVCRALGVSYRFGL